MIEGVFSGKKYNDTFTKWKNDKIINNLYKSIIVVNTWTAGWITSADYLILSLSLDELTVLSIS